MVPSQGEEPLHVASRLHAFNRFELKYLVPVEQAAAARAAGADSEQLDAAAATLRKTVTERGKALAANEQVTG